MRAVVISALVTTAVWAGGFWAGWPTPWPVVDMTLSLLACAALWWRRNSLPLVFAVVLLSAPWAASAIAAHLVLLYTIGTRRSVPATAGAAIGLALFAAGGAGALGQAPMASLPMHGLFLLIAFGAAGAAGLTSRRRRGRTLPEGLTDAALVLGAGVVNLMVWSAAVESGSLDPEANLVFAMTRLYTLSLWWRRQAPVPLAGAGLALAFLIQVPLGAYLLAVFTLAVYHRGRLVLPVAAGYVAATVVVFSFTPQVTDSTVSIAGTAAVLYAAVVGWGMLVRSRQQLLQSLRERARQVEADADSRMEAARQAERQRIAREMHDVLAHRLSLLSVHAGALEYRPDAPADQVAAAAGVVRENAHQAVTDLATVIGVLREEPGPDAAPPQPTGTDLPELISQTEAGGTAVDLDWSGSPPQDVPEGLGRTLYRVVQEALTNVRKHGRGHHARIRVRAEPGEDICIRVANAPDGVAAAPAIPGAGTGLVGLTERVELAGGSLRYGVEASGDFVLQVALPWRQ